MSNGKLVPLDSRRLPAERPQAHAVTSYMPPAPNMGIIDAKLTGWKANHNARSLAQLTNYRNAQTTYIQAGTAHLEAVGKHQEMRAWLADLPDRLGHAQAMAHLQREEEMRALNHEHHINDLQRKQAVMKEEVQLAYGKAEVLQANIAVVDAEQQLKAHKAHAGFNHMLIHKKKTLELLDLELDVEERRALFQKSMKHRQQDHASVDEDEIDEALFARREQLEAAGLDTARIDVVIRKRKGRGRK